MRLLFLILLVAHNSYARTRFQEARESCVTTVIKYLEVDNVGFVASEEDIKKTLDTCTNIFLADLTLEDASLEKISSRPRDYGCRMGARSITNASKLLTVEELIKKLCK